MRPFHFNRRPLLPAILAVLLIVFAGQANSFALSLLRGPYLQMGTTSNITVRWRTSEPASSLVRFGLEPQPLNWQVNDSTPAIDHVVTLTNLAPNTHYYYSVGTPGLQLAGGTNHFFWTAPVQARPTRFWVLGDAGTSFNQPDYSGLGLIREGQRAVRNAYYSYAGSQYANVWLLLGDNAYNDGRDGDYQTNFFEIYPEITRQSVIWSTIGNHDIDVLGTGDDRVYLDIFSLPTQGEAGGVPSGSERYYSFDYGNIHIVCLDSEVSSREPGSPQLTWLEADLSANTRDWLIVFWHSPPYSKGSHDSDVRSGLIKMRQNVVPIVEAYGADLVLCGHSHVYERSYMIDGHYGSSFTWSPAMAKDSGSGRTNESGAYLKHPTGPSPRQGTVYVVAGSSGWTWNHYGLNHPAMFTGKTELGSLIIDVDGQRLDARFLRETGAIDDYFTIVKGSAPEPVRLVTFKIERGTVRAQWKSKASRSYRIERLIDLNSAQWVDESGPITATGATSSWNGPAPNGAKESFYRVMELP